MKGFQLLLTMKFWIYFVIFLLPIDFWSRLKSDRKLRVEFLEKSIFRLVTLFA